MTRTPHAARDKMLQGGAPASSGIFCCKNHGFKNRWRGEYSAQPRYMPARRCCPYRKHITPTRNPTPARTTTGSQNIAGSGWSQSWRLCASSMHCAADSATSSMALPTKMIETNAITTAAPRPAFVIAALRWSAMATPGCCRRSIAQRRSESPRRHLKPVEHRSAASTTARVPTPTVAPHTYWRG